MKAIRLLANSLLVALSMGFSSCGENELESDSIASVDTETIYDKIDKLFAEYIDDYSNIKCRSYLPVSYTHLTLPTKLEV